MCRHIQGNKCSLGQYCRCHPVLDQEYYDDQYNPEYDLYIPASHFLQGQLSEVE